MSSGKQHPTQEKLAAFSLGKLEADESSRIEAHVAACDTCCERLSEVGHDTIVELARAAAKKHSTSRQSELAHVAEILRNHPRYRLEKAVGAGGMGIVLCAQHRLMERTVALKVMNQKLMKNSTAVTRFRQEVKAAARLHHPNIVTAYDAEQIDDLHVLVMEYVEGKSLSQIVKSGGPLPVGLACEYIRQAAIGLQHAFEQGMIHRDVKPHNMMVTADGTLKLLDFGLSRFARSQEDSGRAETDLTTADTVLGTPDYMAPEQASDSRSVDIRADIYGLGCTLYFLLAGRPPFPDGSALEKIASHLHEEPPRISELCSTVPTALADVIDRMLAKSPEQRYQTPAQVAEAIERFANVDGDDTGFSIDSGIRASATAATINMDVPRTASSPPKQPTRRFIPWVAASMVVMVLACIAMYLSSGGGEPEEPARPDQPAAAVLDDHKGPPRILVVAPVGFYAPDMRELNASFRQWPVEMKIAAAQEEDVPSDNFNTTRPLAVDVLLSEATADDYEAVIFIGSGESQQMEFVADPQWRDHAKRFVDEMTRQDKLVCGLCNGNAVLYAIGALAGHRAADAPFVAHGLKPESGATLIQQPVVVDGNFITAQKPEFAGEMVAALKAELENR